MKCFVSGIHNKSKWFEELLKISEGKNIEYFTDKSQKSDCDYLIHIITPLISTIDSIVNSVNDSNYFKEKTLFTFVLNDDGKEFSLHQIKSLNATGKMIELNGGKYFNEFSGLKKYLKNLNSI
jgi:hypothetical protein